MGIETKVANAAQDLRDCLETALGDRPLYPVGEVCLLPGVDFRQFLSIGATENKCCEGSGYAAVQVVNIQPAIPSDPKHLERCGPYTYQVDLTMGVARCAPVGDINAGPTCAQWQAVAQAVWSDAGAMIAAVCCFRPTVESGVVVPTNWIPFDPEGGCTGGIMGVQVQIDSCDCGS